MSQDFPTDLRELMSRLDRAVPPRSDTIGPTEGDPLLESAARVAQLPPVTLSNAAQNRIEERLRARMAELPAARSRPAARAGWRSMLVGWRTLAAALAAVLVVTLAGAARASASSLPGDTLYPVKRAIEGARLAVVSDNAAITLHLEFAARRVDEFDRLLAQGDVHPASFEDVTRDLRAARDLLVAGHGDPAAASGRVAAVAQRQVTALALAEARASADDWAQLQMSAADSAALRAEIDALLVPPHVPPAVPAPTATPTFTPTVTPSATPTATLTPTPSVTPRAAGPNSAPRAPTRTPPGHGATPGLGQNPPGQGGTHPGVGNNGQPPGQNPDKKN